MSWPPLQDVAYRLLHLPRMDVCVHVFRLRGDIILGPTVRGLVRVDATRVHRMSEGHRRFRMRVNRLS
jgi:hypothetical protein